MKRASLRKWFLSAAVVAMALSALAVTPALVAAHPASPAAQSSKPTGRSVIKGHLVPALAHSKAGKAPDNASALSLSISLNLRNVDALNSLIAAQNNPQSGLYHHYLTPQQFAQMFGPTQRTVDTVTAYLRSQGIVVHNVSSNHTLIDASGSASAVASAFQVSLATYGMNGRTVYAPTNEPSVPAALGGLILNVGGLDNAAVQHPLVPARAATGPGGGYTPTELRTAYDMTSLVGTNNGTGQTVAIFELDGYKASDVNNYLSNYSLGAAKYSNVLVDGATNTAGAGAIEVELDMEVVSAISPNATQKIYIGPNTTAGVNDTYNRIVTDNTAKVTSSSWGECESASGTSELQALDNIFAQGAAQGQAFFSAAGDAGAYDCGTTTLAVDSPSDDPHVIGVGGTTLTTGTGGTYTSEKIWSNTADTSRGPKGAGGGGGLSTFFAQPSYQTGPGVTNSFSNGKREVPDVSADADPASGYSVYCTVTASGCSASNGWIAVGGTSAAAPLWAAIAADTNQYLAANSKPVLGSASATIYQLFNMAQSFTAYHDVTTGNNLFYPATSGYDLASGVGTPDVWNFARDAAGISGGSAPTVTSFSPTSGAVGTSVGITGTSFTGATAVKFNGTSATSFTVNSATSITAAVPTGATTGPISVTNATGTGTSSTSFTVTTGGSAPTVTSFSPTSGAVGTSVGLTGTNFTGATAVKFNGTAATSFTVNSATSITATVPTGATTGPISVTNASGTGSSATNFTVTTGGNQAQLIVNGGFESGQTPWSESSTGGFQIVDPTNPHTGSDSAYLCGYNSCNDQIWQTVAIPSTLTKAVETFWVYFDTQESGSTCFDYFNARIRTTAGATITTPLTQCNANAHGWTQYSFDVTTALSTHKGQSVQIYFQGTTDTSLISDVFVDDVTFTVNY